jgi:hypothetical protein
MVTHEVVWLEAYRRVYWHRFVLLDDVFSFRTATNPFTFFQPGIEFCSGLARDPFTGQLILGFGVNDESAWLGFVDEADVLRALAESVMSCGKPAVPVAR